MGKYLLALLLLGILPFSQILAQNPPGQLEIGNIADNASTYPGSQVPKYEKYEITFQVNNTVAANLQMPYDPNPPYGVAEEIGGGISVNAQFSQDDFQTIYTQPAFYYQDFVHQTILNNTRDWIYPTSNYSWKVRFAPPKEGNWQYRLIVEDASGSIISNPRPFIVTTSANKGFVRVSQKDSRYFEYEDGTYFPSLGYNMNYNHVNWEDPVKDNEGNFKIMGQNGIQLDRIWLSEWSIYGSAWNTWTDLRHDFGGYIGRTGVTAFKVDSSDFGRITLGLAYQEDAAGNKNTNWFDACRMTNGFAPQAPLKRNTTYHVKARYRAYNIDGPRNPISLNYGFVIKMQNPSDGNWHVNCYEPSINNSTGQVITPFAHSSTDWSYLEGAWNSGNRDFMPPLYLALENVISTNPIPRVYIDSVELREVLPDGSFGPDVFPKSSMGHHLYFAQRNSYAFDKVVELARQNGVYLRPVVLEKGEDIFRKIDFNGNWAPTDNDAYFYGNWRTMNKVRWLQQAWWRYLQARWGYSTNIHSWELLNEGDPWNDQHYVLADEFGKYMRQFSPNHHLVSTSTWHSFPKDGFWANRSYPNVDFADLHLYVDRPAYPTEFNDSALAVIGMTSWYGAKSGGGAGKPTIRGEVAFFENGPTTQFYNDTQGIWLQKFVWAQINSGGVIESYWSDTDHIWRTWESTNLYNVCNPTPIRTDSQGRPVYRCSFDNRGIFGRYYNFIKDVPLNNGDYQDLGAASSNPNFRIAGQKDTVLGRAHLWIDNKNHTWKNVVDGVVIAPESGTASFSGMPEGSYAVAWYDPYSNPLVIIDTENIVVGPSGTVTLNVYNLDKDIAVKLAPVVTAVTGDINNDTSVNVLDVQACVNHILGIQDSGNRADVNGDGSVNVLDVQYIVNVILGT